jgi:hypothetical protein
VVLRDGFDSPDDAALAGWQEFPGARARVVSSRIINDRAEVVVAVGADPGYLDYAYFVRRDGRWFGAVSGNAPTHRWWDKSYLEWT